MNTTFKHLIFTLVIIFVATLISCEKDKLTGDLDPFALVISWKIDFSPRGLCLKLGRLVLYFQVAISSSLSPSFLRCHVVL